MMAVTMQKPASVTYKWLRLHKQVLKYDLTLAAYWLLVHIEKKWKQALNRRPVYYLLRYLYWYLYNKYWYKCWLS